MVLVLIKKNKKTKGLFDFFKTKNNIMSYKTAEQRKEETEALLKSISIPYIDHLPLTEEENEVKIRTAKEIAERILILTYLNYISDVPDERDSVNEFLKNNSLWEKVSPEEKVLFKKEVLSRKEKINISWRSEAIWLLLWAINKVDNLEIPTEQVEIAEIVSRLPDFLSNPIEFTENVTIRPTSELLDISDLTYRLHWAVRNKELNNLKTLNLNSSVIVERHYAINWVTFYAEEWDEITIDT